MSLLRLVRIAILLTVLLVVTANYWLGKSRLAGWDQPIWITIYPIAADGQAATAGYVKGLEAARFNDIGAFLARESHRHGRALGEPVHIQLAPSLTLLPPPPPHEGNRMAIAWWSLKMRWWAWHRGAEDGLPEADIQIFVLYRQGVQDQALDRSLGIQNGRYAVIHAFASHSQASRNHVVMTHELFHVLGATDKYDLASGQPAVPHGLADPSRSPLFPQRLAEIMGGRIATSPQGAVMPASLRQCVVGALTAGEIGWTR